MSVPSPTTCFYTFIKLVLWNDIVIAFYVIEITDWSAYNSKDITKMVLSLCSIKVLSELVNIFAKWYIKFFVQITDDGISLMKH